MATRPWAFPVSALGDRWWGELPIPVVAKDRHTEPSTAVGGYVISQAIREALPMAPPHAHLAMNRIFSGLLPGNDAVRVPTDGKSATAMVRTMLRVGSSRARRHALPLLETFVNSYSVESVDDERLRSRATMAIGKVVKVLRGRGYPVGVACAKVRGTIFAVPYLVDPDVTIHR